MPSRADGDQARVDLPRVGADPLDGIPRREPRPHRHAGRLCPFRRIEKRGLGVAPLGLEKIVEHGGRGVGKAVVALEGLPDGDHRESRTQLCRKGDPLGKRGHGSFGSVGRDEENAHGQILLAGVSTGIGARSSIGCGYAATGRGETTVSAVATSSSRRCEGVAGRA